MTDPNQPGQPDTPPAGGPFSAPPPGSAPVPLPAPAPPYGAPAPPPFTQPVPGVPSLPPPPGSLPPAYGQPAPPAPPPSAPPPAPPGPTPPPGSASSIPQPGAAADPYSTRVQPQEEPAYAGFWRRFWARGVTSVVTTTLLLIGLELLGAGSSWLQGMIGCRQVANGLVYCTGSDALRWVTFGLAVLFILTTAYWVIARRVILHSATTGMHQLGIKVVSTERDPRVTSKQAMLRSAPLLLLTLSWIIIPWRGLFTPDEDIVTILVVVQMALAGLMLLGGLVSLATEKRQTAWDLAAKTVVVVEREPSWFALLSLVFGLCIPSAMVATIVTASSSGIRDAIDDITGGTVAAILTAVGPIALATLGAIVFGHIGLRATDWAGGRRAGRGMAGVGAFLGYLVPVGIVLMIVFSLLYEEIDEQRAGSCKEARAALDRAVSSFTVLNGRPPNDLDEIESSVYGLTNLKVGDRWEITNEPLIGSRIVGRGSCKIGAGG